MSAIAANVFSGLMKAMIPATISSTANSHITSWSQPPTRAPNMNCWKPEMTNMIPTSTPTVVTEA